MEFLNNPNEEERDEHGDLDEDFVRRGLVSREKEHWPTPWRVSGSQIFDANGDLVCTATTPLLAEMIEFVVFKFSLDTRITSWPDE